MKSAILIFGLITAVLAWETDNFTTRVELLRQPASVVRDNLYRVNNQSNKMIEGAIKHFNKSGNCKDDISSERPKIYKMVKNNMGGGFVSGALEEWAKDEEESGIKIPSLGDSDIYSAMMWTPDPAMNLAGHVVGTDKLGHFVDQGFDLFSKAYLKGDEGFMSMFSKDDMSFTEVLKYSEGLEESGGPYGLTASGVKSYGDLAANFAGMRFYVNLLKGPKPHISCDSKTGKYKLANPMNWADYVDDSFDEGVNCSLFQSMKGPVTPALERKFRYSQDEMNSKGEEMFKNIRKLYEDVYSKEENKDLKFNNFCPVESKKCDALLKNNCANYYVSPRCYVSSSAEKSYSCNEVTPIRPVSSHKYASYTYPAPIGSRRGSANSQASGARGN